MAEKKIIGRIVHKHDTEANWLKAASFTPKQGEIIVYDIDDNYDYERIKIGDGVQNVNALPFVGDALRTELLAQIEAVDGKVEAVSALVGDTSVATQISVALEELPEQVQADWNDNDETSLAYVKNKTHGIEEVDVVAIEEQEVTFGLNESIYMAEVLGTFMHEPESVVENGFAVTWDGDVYNLPLVIFGEDYCVGNVSIITGNEEDNTGEPFVFMCFPEGCLVGCKQSEGATHTVGMSYRAENVKKLDVKYLPNDLAFKYEIPTVPTNVSAFTNDAEYVSLVKGNEKTFEFVRDETYSGDHFIWNAFDYYKVSDMVPSYDDITAVSGTWYANGNISTQNTLTKGTSCYYAGHGVVVTEPGPCTLSNISFNAPSAGVYLKKSSDTYYQTALSITCAYKSLDDSIIPDNIARVEDVLNSTADWGQNDDTQPDYVKNRTHWIEGGGVSVLLEETTLESEDGEFPLSTVLPIIEGETYTVNWNGVEYTCVARTENPEALGGTTVTGFGNVDLIMQTGDTGEPFIVMNAPAILQTTFIMSLDGSTSATISISGASPEVIHKLDNKFIDAEWMATKKLVREKELLAEQSVANYGSIQEVLPGETLRAETEVVVVYDGKEYVCPVQIMSNGSGEGQTHCVGNGELLKAAGLNNTDFASNGEPFVIMGVSYSGGTNVVMYADGGTHTLEIFVGGMGYNKLPEEFLPESVASKEYVESVVASGGVTVDGSLSSTSVNPVQNKVVNAAISSLNTLVGDTAVSEQISTAVSTKADSDHTHDDRYYTETEIDSKLSGKSDTSHTHSAYVNQNAFSKVTVGSTTIEADSTTDTLTLAAGSNITLTPDASGDKITITATDTVYTHPTSGVTAGTYKSVTVNAQGHVTAGSNPTTLSGYGITDAAEKSHSHSNATTSAAGFMSASDKAALDEVVSLVGDEEVSAQISSAVANKADKTHTHAIADVSGLQTALNGKETSGAAASALTSAKSYTDTKISDLINSAPTTLDTLGEIATAMAENDDVVAALEESVGKKANASDLTSHTSNKSNPHGVTASQVGAVPTSRTVNGKALSANITLSASDVGADTSGAASSALTSAKAYTDAEITEWVGDKTVSEQITTAIATKADSGHTHDDRYYTESEINTKLSGKSDTGHNHDTAYAAKNHGNHVPTTETANNAKFLRNDNTWATVTPANIGAAASSHGTHVSYSTTAPVMDGTASVGSADTVARSDHKHPTDTSRASASDLANLKSLVGDTAVSTQINTAISNHTSSHAPSNAEANVQSNWTETSSTSDAYILNKPAIKAGGGTNSIIEGDVDNNTAAGNYAHVEGQESVASGASSHAEGYKGTASGSFGHAEGRMCTASGYASHAEGSETKAKESTSHAEGLSTIAGSARQHVQGMYNIEDTSGTYAHIVGNGGGASLRSNAHTLDWDGNAWFAGNVTVGADNKQLATTDVATTSVAGLMSVADKTKLDGIATGANKITVDSALSSSSTNPVQNKVVNTAISNLNTLVGDTAVATQISNATKTLLGKTTYEYNKELALGSTGKVCIGKFPMYDSNISVEIKSTTNTTYNGTLIIATQNINTTGGGSYTAKVYGDADNSLTNSIKIHYGSGSNVFSVYIDLPGWSKNLLHIQCVALKGEPTDVATTVTEIPSNATIVPTNALKAQLDGKATSGHTHPTATTSAAGFMSAGDKQKLDSIDVSGGGGGITVDAVSASVPTNQGEFYGLAYGNGRFVAVTMWGEIFYSDNGVVWTKANVETTDLSGYFHVAYGAERFVAVGAFSDEVAYSNDGINWTLINNNVTPDGHYGLASSGDVFYTEGSHSFDGITWVSDTAVDLPQTPQSMTCGGGMRVAVGENVIYHAADDGGSEDWASTSTTVTLSAVAYGNGRFMAVGSVPNARYWATSFDGITWRTSLGPIDKTNADVAPIDTPTAIAYGNGKFVVVGNSSACVTYTGENWRKSNIPSGAWKNIVFGNGMFVAMTDAGTFANSVDGINWSTSGYVLKDGDTDVTKQIRDLIG